MFEWSFEAIGAPWTVVSDDQAFSETVKHEIAEQITRFDTTYSRFIANSLICHMAESSETEFEIDQEFQELLNLGIRLQHVTAGSFNLNTAQLQEVYGYDASYSFKNTQAESITLPKGNFTLKNNIFIKTGSVKLDFGAYGKGYLIDLVAKCLEKHGHSTYLVDGGRDFYGTHKADDQPWTIALEHPSDAEIAIGTVKLYHQGLACSNSYHRRVGKYHHLLNAQTGQPISEVASVFLLAQNSFLADGISTALFVSPAQLWPDVIEEFPCQYLIVNDDLSYQITQKFPGEMFS